jgi:zinc finger protein
MYQSERMEQQPEIGVKVAHIISKLTRMAMGEEDSLPFTIFGILELFYSYFSKIFLFPLYDLIVDDPSGNSFIENPVAPAKDPSLIVSYYTRSVEQDLALGLQPLTSNYCKEQDTGYEQLLKLGEKKSTIDSTEETGIYTGTTNGIISSIDKDRDECEDGSISLGRHEAISIPQACPSCFKDGEALTAITDIPHFKEVCTYVFIIA